MRSTSLKLPVLPAADEPAWYARGLRFTCTQCGNCCTGGPGYVWITHEEIERLARHLDLTPEQVVDRYCRKVNGRFSLKERRTSEGNYDCIFLTEAPPDSGDPLALPRRICAVYDARPLQCRTWPFWKENLTSKARWDHSSGRCPGINQGRRFTLRQIHAVRDAADWPEDPPTSNDK